MEIFAPKKKKKSLTNSIYGSPFFLAVSIGTTDQSWYCFSRLCCRSKWKLPEDPCKRNFFLYENFLRVFKIKGKTYSFLLLSTSAIFFDSKRSIVGFENETFFLVVDVSIFGVVRHANSDLTSDLHSSRASIFFFFGALFSFFVSINNISFYNFFFFFFSKVGL